MNAVTRTELRRETPDDGDRADRIQSLWHWIAVGTLLLCWIAEATLCAQRGF